MFYFVHQSPTHFAAALLLAAGAAAANAAEYPARTVRFIIPFPPGGNGDIIGRLIGQRLSENLGQAVVVDNRGGASNIIGTELAVKSPPDGYTILLVSTAHFTNPSLVSKLPYDTVHDLAPVGLVSSTPLVLVAHASLPVKTVGDLLTLARARPGALNFGSTGAGASGHLAAALLGQMTRIHLVHVPYRGTAQATTDLLAGNVQLAFPSLTSVLHYIRQGRLKALGVTGSKRSPLAAELPTVAEAGVPGYQASIWNGILVPAATPPAIIARLNEEIVRALKAPEMRERFSAAGAEVSPGSADEFGAFIIAEIRKWANVIKATGIKTD